MKKIFTNSIISFLLITSLLMSAEIHVGVGQAYSTIQAAVNTSQKGDKIIIHSGTYVLSSQISVPHELTFQAQVGEKVIIDGNNATGIFSGSTTILKNLHIRRSGSTTFRYITVSLYNCILDSNYGWNGGVFFGSTIPVIQNCVFYNNRAGNDGTIASYSNIGRLSNSIFWNNTPAPYGGLYNRTSISLQENNNVQSYDPLFVSPNAGDFSLQNGSACIDAGTIANSEIDYYYDFNYKWRPYDGNGDLVNEIDIGAYEYGSTVTAAVLSNYSPAHNSLANDTVSAIAFNVRDYNNNSANISISVNVNGSVYTAYTISNDQSGPTYTDMDVSFSIISLYSESYNRVTFNYSCPDGKFGLSYYFVVDTDKPRILPVKPFPGEAGVTINRPQIEIIVTDGIQVDTATLVTKINGSTSGFSSTVTATNNGYIVRMVSAFPYQYGQNVEVVLSVEDSSGNPSGVTYNFMTELSNPPSVNYVFPEINSVGQSVDTDIVLKIIDDVEGVSLNSVKIEVDGVLYQSNNSPTFNYNYLYRYPNIYGSQYIDEYSGNYFYVYGGWSLGNIPDYYIRSNGIIYKINSFSYYDYSEYYGYSYVECYLDVVDVDQDNGSILGTTPDFGYGGGVFNFYATFEDAYEGEDIKDFTVTINAGLFDYDYEVKVTVNAQDVYGNEIVYNYSFMTETAPLPSIAFNISHGDTLNYTTIIAAVEAASANDTIVVTPGTHVEAGTVTINKPLKIGSAAGGSSANVIIDGGANKRIFFVDYDPQVYYSAPLIINNLTIQNGYKVYVEGDEGPYYGGGGIFVQAGSLSINSVQILSCIGGSPGGGGILIISGSIAVDNSRFENNNATGGGGGAIYLGASVEAFYGENNIFVNNAGDNCGAIYAEGARIFSITTNVFSNNLSGTQAGAIRFSGLDASVNIVSCTFNSNSAGDGGAIYIDGSERKLSILGSYFEGNHSENNGGAIQGNDALVVVETSTFINNYTGAAGGAIKAALVTIIGSYFEGNTAGDGGAAAGSVVNINTSTFNNNSTYYNAGAVYSEGELKVESSVFNNNYTTGYFGGAIVAGGTISATNNIFNANEAALDGGAVAQRFGYEGLNNTYYGNIAGDRGGAIYVWDSGPYHAVNDIYYNNTAVNSGAQIYQNGPTDISYTLIQGGTYYDASIAADVEVTSNIASRNIDANPLFVDAVNGNLRLYSNSPAIDAGNDTAVAGMPTDISGNSRIQGYHVDMGAYEFEQIINDTTIPTIDPRSPLSSAIDITTTENIIFVLLDSESVVNTASVVFLLNGIDKSAELTYQSTTNGYVATYIPATNLLYNTTYTVTVSAADNQANTANIAYAFTTRAPPTGTVNLDLKVLLHGYYDISTHQQRPATINIQLRSAQNVNTDISVNVPLDIYGQTGVISIDNVQAGNYFVMIRQTLPGLPLAVNHLTVVSSANYSFDVGVVTTMNFSDSASSYYVLPYLAPAADKGGAMIQLEPGIYGLSGGNADGNNVVNVSDILKWDEKIGSANTDTRTAPGFSDAPNFDGNDFINAQDFNVWSDTNGKVAPRPEE